MKTHLRLAIATAFSLALNLAPLPAATAGPANANTAPARNLLDENPRLRELLAAANRASGPQEILRLTAAGADASVIQTYVETSDRRYQLNADQIIQLHQQGVRPGSIAAMIRNGAQPAAQPVPSPAATAQPIVIESEVRAAPESSVTYIHARPRAWRTPYRYGIGSAYLSPYSYAGWQVGNYWGRNCWPAGYWNSRPAWSFDFRFRGCW